MRFSSCPQHLAGRVARALILFALLQAPIGPCTALATCAFSYGDVPDPEPGPSYATLARALRSKWPELFDLMARGDTATSSPSDLHLVVGALVRANRGNIDRVQADLVTYAVSFWFAEYPVNDSLRANELNDLMGPYGGRFEETHDGYCYNDGLLDPLLDRAGGVDRWADYAFLWRMYQGFADHCRACFSASDLFPEVIRRGEQFLALHPRSTIAPDVERMLGEAHETAWSLSLYSDDKGNEGDNFFVQDPVRYATEAPAHRDAAIRLYERYLRASPDEPWSAEVRRRLGLLRANCDTQFYKYYCCCWD